MKHMKEYVTGTLIFYWNIPYKIYVEADAQHSYKRTLILVYRVTVHTGLHYSRKNLLKVSILRIL